MDIQLFLVSLVVAVLGPVLAIAYLRAILVKVLVGLCDAEGGAEFWIRSAYLLAICGTVLLMLGFGRFDADAELVDTLRRSLLLVFAGVFTTCAFIARNVWTQVRQPQHPKRPPALPTVPSPAQRVADAHGTRT